MIMNDHLPGPQLLAYMTGISIQPFHSPAVNRLQLYSDFLKSWEPSNISPQEKALKSYISKFDVLREIAMRAHEDPLLCNAMDALKLLSRSTNLHKKKAVTTPTPSTGQNANPQLFFNSNANTSRKRKRGHEQSKGLNFFGGASTEETDKAAESQDDSTDKSEVEATSTSLATVSLTEDESKVILRSHKLKVTWLNTPLAKPRARSIISKPSSNLRSRAP